MSYSDQLKQLKYFVYFWVHLENMTERKWGKVEAFNVWCEGCAERYRALHPFN